MLPFLWWFERDQHVLVDAMHRARGARLLKEVG